MNKFCLFLSAVFLILFTASMTKNLGNTAFWEDEGETVQLGKSILKFGYPSVFDGRSFILIDNNFNKKNYLRLTSPYLQFYIAALALWLTRGIADTSLIRIPFASIAVAGVWLSWIVFRRRGYSRFALSLYSFFMFSSIQLYLYWRQARHYALQFPLALGLLVSYLNLGKKGWNVLFFLLGFLFYHTYYPGFLGFYAAILVHATVRKFIDHSYRVKPLVINTALLFALHVPAAFYLHHFGQLQNNGYVNTLWAYFVDLNYFAYLKIILLSIFAIAVLNRSAFRNISFKKMFRAYHYSLSLFMLVIFFHVLIISLGAHNSRYISVIFPFLFLLVALFWEMMMKELCKKFHLHELVTQFVSIPFLLGLMLYSHPQFLSQISGFIDELQGTYLGPIEGVVNTVAGVTEKNHIDAASIQRPGLLLATNFEDGALYSYLDNQFLNSLAPDETFRTGTRLPDWVIIRKNWGQEEYLQSFLQRGRYEKIETDYCDLSYENVYLVRTHHFESVTDCPDSKLTLYRLKQ